MAITGTNDQITWLTAASDTISGKLYLGKLIWSGVGTGGDDLQVMDADSNVQIFKGKAGQYEVIDIDFPGDKGLQVNGVKITTIDSGQVGIYRK